MAEIARFGYEVFYVNSTNGIYTPSDLSIEYGKAIEKQSTAGSKPKSFVGDINLITSGFKIHLDARFVDVEAKINTWRQYAESKYTYPLIVNFSLEYI